MLHSANNQPAFYAPNVDVLLVSVTDVEAEAALAVLETHLGRRAELRVLGDKTYFDVGMVGRAHTCLIRTEIGSGGVGGSLLAIEASIQALAPAAIIMLGIAFGVDRKRQRLGDILIAQQLLLYDLQRLSSGAAGEVVARLRGDRPSASIRLLDYARSSAHSWRGAAVHVGLLLSGDKLIDHQGFRDALVRQEPEAIGGEMEGAGLYAAAQRRKVDWLVVKAICDWADGTKGQNKQRRQQVAARNAAEFVLHMLLLGGLARQTIASPPPSSMGPPPRSLQLGSASEAPQPRQLPGPPAAIVGRLAQPPAIDDAVVRAADLAALQARLSRERLVIITGMPGVGKTTLAAMLARRAAPPEQIFWHSCRADSGADVILWALAAFLAWHGHGELWAMLQQRALGSQPAPLELLYDYVAQVVAASGYVLCFDDVHLLDDDGSFTRLLERLRPQPGGAPVMLILIARQVPSFARLAEVEALAGMSAPDARNLVQARGLVLDNESFERMYAQTHGNAQFLTLAIDALKRATNPARLLAELVTADDIERYLLQQIDTSLSDSESLVMRAVAALLEYGGSQAAVAALLDDSLDLAGVVAALARLHERFLLDLHSLRAALRGLSDRFLLTAVEGPAGREYHQHAIVRAFYYAGLTARERAVLHRRAGTFYTQAEREPLRAALHYEQAGDPARAADALTADAWALINAGHARQMLPLLEHLSQAALDPDRQIEIGIALGEVSTLLRVSARAHSSYQQALALASSRPDAARRRAWEVRICRGMGELLEFEAPQAALGWLRRGLELAGGVDTSSETRLRYRMSSVLISTSNYAEARAELERCLQLLPGDDGLRADVLMNIGAIDYAQGELDRSKHYFNQSLPIYQHAGDLWHEAVIRQNLGVLMTLTGEWADAVAEYQRALALAEQLGSTARQADVVLNLGVLHMRQGDLLAAGRSLAQGIALAERHALNEHMVYAQTNRAALAIRERRWDEAATALTQAERLAGELLIRSELPEIYRSWALVHLARGETELALARVQRALALAQELDDQLGEGVGRQIEALALLAGGQRDMALEAFARSAALLAGDPYELARTQAAWGRALSPNDPARGRALVETARASFARLGARRDLGELEGRADGEG